MLKPQLHGGSALSWSFQIIVTLCVITPNNVSLGSMIQCERTTNLCIDFCFAYEIMFEKENDQFGAAWLFSDFSDGLGHRSCPVVPTRTQAVLVSGSRCGLDASSGKRSSCEFQCCNVVGDRRQG